MNNKVTFSGVDLFKFIFSICVVFIHTNFWNLEKGSWTFDIVYPLIFRLAVPYFFVASGFFFYRKLFSDKFNLKKYLWRLGKKLVVFEPISLILQCGNYLLAGKSIVWIIMWAGRSILFYPVGALWYIQALIVAILIIYTVAKWRGKNWRLIHLLPVSLILYFIACFTNRYYFVIENTPFQNIADKYILVFVSGRNGLMYGLLFVLLGCLIAKHYDKIITYKKYFTFILILCFISGFIEIYLIHGQNGHDDWATHFSHLFIVPMLFIFTSSIKVLSEKISKNLRNLSTSIYLLHSPVISIIKLSYQMVTKNEINNIILFIITVLIVGGICAVIYKTRKQPFYDLIR